MSWIGQVITGVALTSLSLSFITSSKAEISFTFEQIADTNTPISGGTDNLDSFAIQNLSLAKESNNAAGAHW